MHEEREITLSRDGRELAQSSEILEILHAIADDDETPWVDVRTWAPIFETNQAVKESVEEFSESEAFSSLTPDEQQESLRSSKAVLGKNHGLNWLIESPSKSGPLAEKPRLLRQIPAIGVDALLLSGITIDDICRSSPALVSAHESLGFKRKIDFANFVGACIISNQFDINRFVEFDLETADGIKQIVGIGGSQHGDFRIKQDEIYEEGSVDPSGNKVLYAPKGPERWFGAYHSVEPLVLTALLRHLDAIGWPEESQKECLRKVLNVYGKKDDGIRGGGLFADFGLSDGEYQMYEIETYYEDGDVDLYKKRGLIWQELTFSPVNTDTVLAIRTIGEDLVIAYCKRGENWQLEQCGDFSIKIPPHKTEDFLLALLNQAKKGLGRTSDTCLISILKARLNTDWH